MKKIAGLFISALLLLSSCGSVPVTGRSQLLLVSDSEVLTSSLTQYSDYMKSAPLSTDSKGKAMVTRVGKNIAAATEQYVGERTSTLSGTVSTIMGDKRFLAQTGNLMDHLGIGVQGYVSSIIGQASYMIPKQEKEVGCVLIDSGFATTTIAILQGEGILFQKTIPFGAKQIITDMMQGLGISYSEADALKRRYVFGIDNDSGQMQLMQILDRTDKARKYETSLVSDAIEARMRDTLDRIERGIDESGYRLANRSCVYLTGGGFAMMHGIRQFASAALGRNVQILNPQSPRFNSAVYANVLGVVDHIAMQYAKQGRFAFLKRN